MYYIIQVEVREKGLFWSVFQSWKVGRKCMATSWANVWDFAQTTLSWTPTSVEPSFAYYQDCVKIRF
jgi:hypothetical protein